MQKTKRKHDQNNKTTKYEEYNKRKNINNKFKKNLNIIYKIIEKKIIKTEKDQIKSTMGKLKRK